MTFLLFFLTGVLAADSSGSRSAFDPLRCRLSKTVLAGEDYVFGVSLSGTREWAAAGARDGTVRIWNARTWSEVRKWKAHEAYCYAAVFSPDVRTLATGGLDGGVKLWNFRSGALDRTLRTSGGAVMSLAFASGGRRLVMGGADGARVWNLADGKGSVDLQGHEQGVNAVAALGDRAVTAGSDGTVRVWDLEKGETVALFSGHGGGVYALAFHPEGKWIASAGADKSIRLWDPATAKPVKTLEGPSGPVHALAFASGGNHLISGGASSAQVWDCATGTSLRTLDASGVPAYGIAVDGGRVVITGGDNRIRLWGPEDGAGEPAEAPREKGFLGISYGGGEGGALVTSVVAGSQAEKTGFQAGDMILEANGTVIERRDDFLQFMRASHEGDEVHLKIRRDGAFKFIRVKLGRWSR